MGKKVSLINMKREVENYIRETEVYVSCCREKILPIFTQSHLEEEANQIEKRKVERLSKSFDPEIDDETENADRALDFAYSHYILMNKIKQGLLNLFAVGLYHLFEQQLFKFYRHVFLKPEEENGDNLKIAGAEVKTCLKNNGIDLEQFSSWRFIDDELRLLANTVKHAEGESSRTLKKRRPGLFEDPDLRQLDSELAPESRPKSKHFFPLNQPLMGDGIYVSFEELQSYAEHIKSFWLNFENALEHISHK